MTYEKKSVIELREIAKERKIKGIKETRTDRSIRKLWSGTIKTKGRTADTTWTKTILFRASRKKTSSERISKEYKESGQRRKSTWDSGSYARWVWFHPMWKLSSRGEWYLCISGSDPQIQFKNRRHLNRSDPYQNPEWEIQCLIIRRICQWI